MHFENKEHLHSLKIWEVIDSGKSGYLNGQKLSF